MKTHLHFYVSKWPLVPTYFVCDSKSQTPIPIFFLFLNGLYVSSPTSLVYDSKTQTPISIFISLNGLSFFCCQLASTSHLRQALVYDSKTQTPISISISLNGLSFFCCQLASTSHLGQALFTTPKSRTGGNRYPPSLNCDTIHHPQNAPICPLKTPPNFAFSDHFCTTCPRLLRLTSLVVITSA